MHTYTGTTGFRAPELYSDPNSINYNRSIDLFSLGVILYMLLQTKSKLEDEKMPKNQSYKYSIKDFNSSHNQELKDLALRMLDHDPEKRPVIRDVVATLEKLQSEAP